MLTPKEKIIKYCQSSEHCHSQVRNKLYEYGCRTDEVNELIADLITSNLLNEQRFTDQFVYSHMMGNVWSSKQVKYRLGLLKVSEYCIKDAFTKFYNTYKNEYYDKLKRKVAQQLTKNNKNKSQHKKYKEQLTIAHFVRTGFKLETIKNMVIEINS